MQKFEMYFGTEYICDPLFFPADDSLGDFSYFGTKCIEWSSRVFFLAKRLTSKR